jgi:homoserine O-acetyltransferase
VTDAGRGGAGAPGATSTPDPTDGGGRPPVAARFGSGRVEPTEVGPLRLESGDVLTQVHVAYRHDGPGPDEAPQVVVVHALTGSADAAGDWWAPVIGPRKAFDTDRVGVICANLLGGRYGTTGPTSPDPATRRPYGRSFPVITPRDMAHAQWALLDALGIREVALLVGGSLGGMVALEIALARPAAVGTLMPIAAPAATGALALAWDHVQLALIDRLGEEGMDFARRLALTTYRSEADFDDRFGRDREEDGRLSIVSYLGHQGQKLVDRFDPDTYRTLVTAMDAHDVGRGRGGIVEALRTLAPGATERPTALRGVAIGGDILYGPAQVRALVDAASDAGMDAAYREFASRKGHDAFLAEWGVMDGILRDGLAEAIA